MSTSGDKAESVDAQYADLLFRLLVDAKMRSNRTGEDALSVFGHALRIDLGRGFPLLTTKRLHTRSIVAELAWFLQGLTNVGWLNARGVTIWNEWADAEGELGPIYGRQWRSWPCPNGESVDQVRDLVRQIVEEPHSRRLIVSSWNVAEIPAMALPPCHCLFQFYVDGGRLDCQVYQRSADVFLGLPFNIASYALLVEMVAAATGLRAGWLHHIIGDAHLYRNHLDQAREQLIRPPRPLPRVSLAEDFDLFGFDVAHVAFDGYQPHPAIHAEVAK